MPSLREEAPVGDPRQQQRDGLAPPGRARAAMLAPACRTAPGRAPRRPGRGGSPRAPSPRRRALAARAKRSCSGPKPGSRRQSSSTDTSPGITLIFSPPRTIVGADGVVQQRVEHRGARSPSTSSTRSVRRGRSSPRSGSATAEGSSTAIASIIAARPPGSRARAAGAVEPLQQPPERAHRAAPDRHRPVPGAPAQRRARPADLLLGHHDRVEARGRRRPS